MVVKSGGQGIYFQQQVMSVNGKNEKTLLMNCQELHDLLKYLSKIIFSKRVETFGNI